MLAGCRASLGQHSTGRSMNAQQCQFYNSEPPMHNAEVSKQIVVADFDQIDK
jgi:hypothetical protein